LDRSPLRLAGSLAALAPAPELTGPPAPRHNSHDVFGTVSVLSRPAAMSSSKGGNRYRKETNHYCELCNCWLANNPASIDFHATGKQHKENVATKLRESRQRAVERNSKVRRMGSVSWHFFSAAQRTHTATAQLWHPPISLHYPPTAAVSADKCGIHLYLEQPTVLTALTDVDVMQ